MCTFLIIHFKTFETPLVTSVAADHIFATAIMEKKIADTICSDVSTIINTNINEHTWSPDKQRTTAGQTHTQKKNRHKMCPELKELSSYINTPG